VSAVSIKKFKYKSRNNNFKKGVFLEKLFYENPLQVCLLRRKEVGISLYHSTLSAVVFGRFKCKRARSAYSVCSRVRQRTEDVKGSPSTPRSGVVNEYNIPMQHRYAAYDGR